MVVARCGKSFATGSYYPSEGIEAWSNPCGNLGFVGGEIGSPTVAHECRSPPRMKIERLFSAEYLRVFDTLRTSA